MIVGVVIEKMLFNLPNCSCNPVDHIVASGLDQNAVHVSETMITVFSFDCGKQIELAGQGEEER